MQSPDPTPSPAPRVPGRSRRFRALGLVIGLVLLLTYVPLSRAMDLGPMYTRGPEGEWSVRNQDLRHWRGLRWNMSKGHGSQGVESWTPGLGSELFTPYPTRRVWIVCQTPGKVAHALGEALTKQLLANDDMVEVAFFPFVQLPVTEFRPPDLWVTLDQLADESTTLPGFFSASGSIAMTISPRLHNTLNRAASEIEAPFFASLLNYDKSQIGLISAAGRWKRLGDELVRSAHLETNLRLLQGECTQLPAVLGIELLHGSIRCTPIQALRDLGRQVQQLKEGPAWMVHNLTAWSIKPGADRRQRIQSLHAALIEEGWTPVSSGPRGFRVKLGERQLTVGEQIDRDWFSSFDVYSGDAWDESPIGVQHLHEFTAEECVHFLNQRIEQGLSKPQLHALLAQLSPGQRQAIADSYWQRPVDETGEAQPLVPPHLFQIIGQLSDPKLKQQ
ncbi:MAG: hypothetical protein GY930_17095 [bacterium]|nr:hypothetical protein [bacterium]